MIADRHTELESRIHDLLAGNLDDLERCDLLRKIARDDAARRLLGEIAEIQWQARASLGLQIDTPTVQSALAKTLDALRAVGVQLPAGDSTNDYAATPGVTRRSWRPALMRSAAVLLLVASIFVSYWIGANRRVDHHPGPVTDGNRAGQAAIPDLKPEDLGVLRKTWEQIAIGSNNTRPWIVMFNGNEPGEFGYLPADSQATDDKGPILVRCILIAKDQPPRQLNVLLSRRQSDAVSVTGIGCLQNGTLDLAVSSVAGRVSVGLKVSGGPWAESGLQGTVLIDQKAVDAGRFRVDGQMMQVFFQALTLTG